MLFLPLLFQRRFLARFLFGKSWQSIPFGRSFSFQGTIGKTKSRYIDIKNQREFFSRFKMMKLCIGSANSETTCLFLTNHANRQCVNGWCGYDRLPLALPKKSFIFYSVVVTYKLSLYIIQNKCLHVKILIISCIQKMSCEVFTGHFYHQLFAVFFGSIINVGV